MEFLIFAIIGGLLPDVIRLIKNRHGSLPDYLLNINFYIGLILLLGVGLLAVYFKQPKDELETLAIAFSAPQIISSLIGTKLKKPSDSDTNDPRLMNVDNNEDKKGLFTFLRNWW